MTGIPQAAIDAAEATLRGLLEPWLPLEVHGSSLERQIPTAARLVLRDAAPHLAAATWQRAIALADKVGASYLEAAEDDDPVSLILPFADLLRKEDPGA